VPEASGGDTPRRSWIVRVLRALVVRRVWELGERAKLFVRVKSILVGTGGDGEGDED